MYTGGPQAAFANWTMVGGFSFFVSLAMAEIAASMPTAGGMLLTRDDKVDKHTHRITAKAYIFGASNWVATGMGLCSVGLQV
jgi:amino acid permease